MHRKIENRGASTNRTAVGLVLLLAVLFALVLPSVVSAADSSTSLGYRGARGARAEPCHAPRLQGLTLDAARALAAKARCRLRLLGAPVERAEIQTIGRQSRRVTQHGRVLTVWLNPLCSGSADWGPPRNEPRITSGPTELVSGLYLDGGPHRDTSVPRCESLAGPPGAGTITVTNPANAALVATETFAEGQFAKIPLPAGTYTVVGTFATATSNGKPIESSPQTVTIPAGKTVRQDVSVGIS